MKKIDLNDIKQGALLGEAKTETLEFMLHGEKVSVDVRIVQLSYAQTAPYYQALQNGELEKVAAEWVAQSLVDDDGKTLFTAQQVKDNFSYNLLNSAIERILSLNVLATEVLNEDEEDAEKKNEP